MTYLQRHSLVWVTTEFVSFHRWPEAASVLPERAYLASRHRHKFFVRVDVSVGGDNREIEFHDLKDNVDTFIALEIAGGNWPESLSCEQMADRIMNWVSTAYPHRDYYSVSVAEDNENGAQIEAFDNEEH